MNIKNIVQTVQKRTSYITQGRSLWLHKEPVSTAIYKFKYNNKRSWGELFAAEMAEYYADQVKKWEIEEIIPNSAAQIPKEEKEDIIRQES